MKSTWKKLLECQMKRIEKMESNSLLATMQQRRETWGSQSKLDVQEPMIFYIAKYSRKVVRRRQNPIIRRR